MEDEAIIALYWNRSEQAITETAAKYGGFCRGIANAILSDPEDAEEALNDTWLGAWNAIPPNRPPVLRAFLGRITRLVSLTRRRDRGRQKRGGSEVDLALDELGECIAGGRSAEEDAITDELRAAINRFLRSLPHPEQQVFLCRYWYLDPLAEICRQFSFSEGKVKSMLFRTRKKLRDFLSEEGYL